jgi:hypothetical protein
MTISYDYDDTLVSSSGTVIQETKKKMMADIMLGHRVVIVTGRCMDQPVDLDKLGLGQVPVYYTCGELKGETLKILGVNVHYDDKQVEIDDIKRVDPTIETVKVGGKTYGTAVVVDFGTFEMVAHRLAQDFEKVKYFTPWVSGFPTITDTLVGKGYEDIERIDNLFENLDADLFYFPEVSMGDLQKHLVSLGKNVWGSRGAEKLEMDRWGWLKLLESLSLNIPESRLVHGMDELQKILESEDDLYVKTPDKNRGQFETFHHVVWETTKPLFDKVKFESGPASELLVFIVQKPIKGELEFGFDTWCIDGEFPETLMIGYEEKECGYFCKIANFSDLPEGIREILEKLKPTLKAYGYRGSFSAEFRQEGDKWIFTDPCMRDGNPICAVKTKLLRNFSEIALEGARGNMVQPDWSAKFGGEITVNSEFLCDNFGELLGQDEWTIRINSCQIGGVEWNVPNGKRDSYGSVVSIGDDADEMLDQLTERTEKISGYKVEIATMKNAGDILAKLKGDDSQEPPGEEDDMYDRTKKALMKEVHKGFPDKKHELYKKFEDNIDKFSRAKARKVAREIKAGGDPDEVTRKYDRHLDHERETAFYTARSAYKLANKKK